MYICASQLIGIWIEKGWYPEENQNKDRDKWINFVSISRNFLIDRFDCITHSDNEDIVHELSLEDVEKSLEWSGSDINCRIKQQTILHAARTETLEVFECK